MPSVFAPVQVSFGFEAEIVALVVAVTLCAIDRTTAWAAWACRVSADSLWD
jgi:hypothetical protein